MMQKIDGAVFRRMVLSGAAAVELQKQKINELNVFPVPDGDTGTNMSMTLNAAVTDLQKHPEADLARAAGLVSSALLRGARGNSGVILSLLFRGFSKSFKGLTECDGKAFAEALTLGVEAAYKAVMRPAEGTILTVSRLTAAAITQEAGNNCEFEHILQVAVDTCREAVANTTEQNPVLKKAGVVDAGGQGFLTVLEGMLSSLQGTDIVAEPTGEGDEDSVFADFDTADIHFAFDTVYIIRKKSETVDLEPLRSYLNSIGDCLVIGEDDEAFKVHVHTNIPGEALTESQKYGTLELAKIENMQTQHDDLAAGRKPQSTDDLEQVEKELENQDAAPTKPFGVVTVCAGDGVADVFRELGTDGVISGGQTMNPSTDDILAKIRQVPAETVFVLPNNKNIIMAAQQAAKLCKTKKVVVIESKTVPQGITAMLNYDPEGTEEAIQAAMTEALANVSTLQITYAARDSDFDGYDIHEGDFMALNEGKLMEVNKDISVLLQQIAQLVNEEGREFISIYYGADISAEEAAKAEAIFQEFCFGADITLVNGGQPVYYYMISAE